MNEPAMNSWQDHNRNVPPAKAPNTWKEQEGTVPGRGTWAGWGVGLGLAGVGRRTVHRLLGMLEDARMKHFLFQGL